MAKESAKKNGSKKSSSLVRLVPWVVVLLIIAAVIGVKVFKQPGTKTEFQKGMGYSTWSQGSYLLPSSDESLERVREVGTDYVSILVTWYQTTCWSGDIHRTEKTPSDEAMIHVIQKAHRLGMKVMITLRLDLLDKSDGSWRGEICCVREADWDEWFRKYTEFVMYYVDMAKKEKVEMISIGTELSAAATAKGYLWKDLIKKVRSGYSGLLTYAAHWDCYMDIRFWDQLDYVGINPYFPLTEEMEPTYDELMQGWNKWLPEIEDFQQKIGKPVIFPECGCNSADGAAIRPWEHVPRTEVNLELQENYYRTLLETFWGKEWFYGLYWWYWGTNMRMGGKYNRGFTPQNKPAEQLVKEWYAKPAPR
ncbi:MAG: hypothetical protein U9R44_00470 [Candidatus Omnitrophota bacterium]|nr:hypothetical protein [Candidatus Omnitrophota bacterium]